jgi:hypothetical protein
MHKDDAPKGLRIIKLFELTKPTSKEVQEMKSMVDILCGLVGLIALAVTVWQLLSFLGYKDARGLPDMMSGSNHLWLAIGAAIVACACGVYLFIHNRKPVEEIHITD